MVICFPAEGWFGNFVTGGERDFEGGDRWRKVEVPPKTEESQLEIGRAHV